MCCYNIKVANLLADVAELAYAHDSKSCGEIHTGSTPVIGTIFLHMITKRVEKTRLYCLVFSFFVLNKGIVFLLLEIL